MPSILQLSLDPVALPFSVALAVCCLYWLVKGLGIFDLDLFATQSAATAGASDTPPSSWARLTFAGSRFSTEGFVTLLLLCGWLCALYVAHRFPERSWAFGLVMVVPISCCAFVAARFAAIPLSRLLPPDSAFPAPVPEVVGCVCVVLSREVTPEFGEAEIQEGPVPQLIRVRSEGSHRLAKGDRARVIRKIPGRDVFFIEPLLGESPCEPTGTASCEADQPPKSA